MARVYAAQFLPSALYEGIFMSTSSLLGNDIISIKDLTLEQIQTILTHASEFKANPKQRCLQDKIIAHCFFEPSTRTRLSFETATLRLGGQVIGFSSDDHLSTKKGESLHDTVRVISDYADLIIIRHAKEGAARLAADISPKSVINAGDGANQHPTQALVDLFTIKESQQQLDGLNIALVGDLKYGRAIHSLVEICMYYSVRLFLVAPEALTLPESLCDVLKKNGVRFSFHQTLEEVIPKVDILYMTRIQQERLNDAESQLFEKQLVLVPSMLAQAKSNLKILHPLPRVNEMDVRIDATPNAYYFEQAANAVYVRQALLTLLLGRSS